MVEQDGHLRSCHQYIYVPGFMSAKSKHRGSFHVHTAIQTLNDILVTTVLYRPSTSALNHESFNAFL